MKQQEMVTVNETFQLAGTFDAICDILGFTSPKSKEKMLEVLSEVVICIKRLVGIIIRKEKYYEVQSHISKKSR